MPQSGFKFVREDGHYWTITEKQLDIIKDALADAAVGPMSTHYGLNERQTMDMVTWLRAGSVTPPILDNARDLLEA